MLTDIGAEGMSLERACAVAVRLLDLGYFRIGNDVYTDTNGSFGLTTLLRGTCRDAARRCASASSGKSGVEHDIDIDDAAAIEALDVMRRRRGGDDRLLAWKDGRTWRDLLVLRGQRLHPRMLPASRRRRRTSAPGTPR